MGPFTKMGGDSFRANSEVSEDMKSFRDLLGSHIDGKEAVNVCLDNSFSIISICSTSVVKLLKQKVKPLRGYLLKFCRRHNRDHSLLQKIYRIVTELWLLEENTFCFVFFLPKTVEVGMC